MEIKFPIPIKEVQYYINNTCNLSCNNCASFNNFNFKNYFKWEDTKDKNSKWPKYIIPGRISILGGEPFLNPDFLSWLEGIRKAWPDHKNLTIVTNGTLFSKKKYINYVKRALELNFKFEISIHHENYYNESLEAFKKILDNLNIEYYETFEYDPAYTNQTDLRIINSKFSKSPIAFFLKAYQFENIGIINKTNTINFYSNDKDKAHDMCGANQCHYIVNGDLYKCVLTGVAKLFSEQFNINKESLKLISEYKSCNPNDNENTIKEFILNIKNSINQCSLCPVTKFKINAL
jgi:organic radical activating enzyme